MLENGHSVSVHCRGNNRLKSGRKVGQSISYYFEDIAKHFDKSLAKAARNLDMCETTLKKLCRTLGIQKWPYKRGKKRKRLDSEVNFLQHINPGEPHQLSSSEHSRAATTLPVNPSGDDSVGGDAYVQDNVDEDATLIRPMSHIDDSLRRRCGILDDIPPCDDIAPILIQNSDDDDSSQGDFTFSSLDEHCRPLRDVFGHPLDIDDSSDDLSYLACVLPSSAQFPHQTPVICPLGEVIVDANGHSHDESLVYLLNWFKKTGQINGLTEDSDVMDSDDEGSDSMSMDLDRSEPFDAGDKTPTSNMVVEELTGGKSAPDNSCNKRLPIDDNDGSDLAFLVL